MGTRALTDEQEAAIDNLWMLTFGVDAETGTMGALVSAEHIAAASITPGDEPNLYNVRISLPDGSHKIVLLANAADLETSVSAEPNPVGEVDVDGLIWAKTDAIGGNAFATSETAYNDIQFNWYEATTGAIGATSGGVSGTRVRGICPTGWRIPTNVEYADLMTAASNKGSATSGDLTDRGNYTSNPAWNATAPRSTRLTLPNGTLIFPASGFSDGDSNQGLLGGAWTSVEYPSDTSNAYHLYFSNSFVYPAINSNKNLAYSVRCVRGGASVDALEEGQTLGDVEELFDIPIAGKLFTATDDALPMWGESDVITTGGDTQNIRVDLHRAVAKADVMITAAARAQFELTNVIVAKPNNAYSILSSEDALDEDGAPSSPVVPAEATPFTLAESVSLFNYPTPDGADITNTIYLPETEISADDAYTDRMALLVGGKYKGVDPDNETITWYRLNFANATGADDAGPVDVIRNHRYAFTVSFVRGVGAETAADAYVVEISNMTVTVKDWDEVPFDDIELD